MELSEDDKKQILGLIDSLPDVDKQVLSISQHGTEVSVRTGWQTGPRCGGGHTVVLQKISERWQVKMILRWNV
jgi:hypothetical protein